MNSSYGPCTVELFNSLLPEGEPIDKAKVTFLGESPNALVRLYQYVPGVSPDGISEAMGRFKCIDTIGAGEVTEVDDDTFTVTGISQQLVEEVGLPESDASVTWRVHIKGCETC